MYWQIAIDGPAAAGKSTIAKMLAKKLNFSYLDTGAMYRAITYKALTLKINMENENEYSFLESTTIDFFNGKLYLDGKDVSEEIRSVDVTNNASLVAKFGYVRSALVKMQRKIAESKNIIMDGRDIGTVVLPKANLKVYLIATITERSHRRFKERQSLNPNSPSLEETIAEIQERDKKDMSREISPLKRADDAIEIDTSLLSIDDVVDKIIRLVMERGYKMESVKTTNEEIVVEESTVEATEKVKAPVKKTTKKQPEKNTEVVADEKPAKKTKAKKEETTEEVAAEKPAKTTKAKKDVVAEVEVAEVKPVKKTATKKVATEEVVVNEKPVKKAKAKKDETPEAVVEETPAKKAKAKKDETPEAVVEETPAKKAKAKKDETPEAVVEETPAKKAKAKKDETPEAVVEETPAKKVDEVVEETTPEVVVNNTEPVHEMQLVEGVIKDIIKSKRETINQQGKTVRKEKEEKLLIQLDNGQEGFLNKVDIADFDQEEDLEDVFMEGERITSVVKRIYKDGGKVLLSTILIKKREEIHKFDDIIKNHGVFSAKVVRAIKVGLILEFEGYSCLLPNSQVDIAPENYSEFIGKEMVVAPIRVDYNRVRLIVSQTVANAIQNREEKQKFLKTVEVGQDFDGTVKNIESYGAFVEIAPGVEGLLHISEIEHNRIVKVEKVINVGDTVKVRVIKIEGEHIGLSRKVLLPNHWKSFMEENPVGSEVKGKVAEINRAGVVVTLNENVNGFLPKSEFSWERDTYIEDYIALNDEIDAKIIELDLGKKRIILSRKQLSENPWDLLKLRSGDKVEATVVKVLKEGVKVSVNGASGFLPKGNFGIASEFTEGETLNAKVRLFDPQKTKLIITLREDVQMDRTSVNKLLKSQEKVTSTFGDFIDLDNLNKSRKKRR